MNEFLKLQIEGYILDLQKLLIKNDNSTIDEKIEKLNSIGDDLAGEIADDYT